LDLALGLFCEWLRLNPQDDAISLDVVEALAKRSLREPN
jgi:hypothetical protein